MKSTLEWASIATGLASCSLPAPQVQAQVSPPESCVGYDTLVTLRGTVLRREFSGDSVWLLRLDAPIATCPIAGRVTRNVTHHSDVNELQLALFSTLQTDSALLSLLGHKLGLQGRLEEAALTHDHTAVLLDVERLLLADGSTRDVRPPPSRPRWDSTACLREPVPEITTRRVGNVPLDSSVSSLWRAVPNHWSARWPVSADSELKALQAHLLPGDYAAVAFHLGCFDLTGTQLQDSIDPNAPLKLWNMMGVTAALPRGVPLHATWSELRTAYGDRYTVGERGMIRFCSLRGLAFDLRGYLWMLSPRQDPPPDARVRSVLIAPFDSGSACKN